MDLFNVKVVKEKIIGIELIRIEELELYGKDAEESLLQFYLIFLLFHLFFLIFLCLHYWEVCG